MDWSSNKNLLKTTTSNFRSVCEILREINDLCQGEESKDYQIRDKCSEAIYKAKRMAKKLKEYNKNYNAGWWEDNKEYEASLEKRMQLEYRDGDRHMIVIVLGMHKSGTTMVAKALHKTGVDMAPATEGTYDESKYEDPAFAKINHMILRRGQKRYSLDLPDLDNMRDDKAVRLEIKKYIKSRGEGSWGAKHPDTTLTYPIWRKYLPVHFAFGIYRPMGKVIEHYMKNQPNKVQGNVEKIITAYNTYNNAMMKYNIPIFHYEELLQKGFWPLNDYLGMKLEDVRIKGKKS